MYRRLKNRLNEQTPRLQKENIDFISSKPNSISLPLN